MGTGPLFSFIKELYFNKEALGQTARRNRLVTLLVFSHVFLFLLLLFRTEQGITLAETYRKTKEQNVAYAEKVRAYDAIAKENYRLVHETADAQNRLIFLQSDYNELNRALSNCLTQRRVCSTPKVVAKKPLPKKKDPTYVQILNQQLKD